MFRVVENFAVTQQCKTTRDSLTIISCCQHCRFISEFRDQTVEFVYIQQLHFIYVFQ